MDEPQPAKRSIADLVAEASRKAPAAEPRASAPPPGVEIYIPKPYVPPKPPAPISMRLADMRKKTDDELMQWLTTESEHPNRPLDEGTKMAITAELMRRHTKPHTPSFVLLVVSVVLALASLGYSIWQGQQTKVSPPDSTAGSQTKPPAASAAR